VAVAKGRDRVDELVVVHGSSSRAVADRVEGTMRLVEGCVVSRPAPDTVMIATSSRAVLGRKSQSCRVHVISEPQRLVVGIHGELGSDLLTQLKNAILGTAVKDLPLALPTYAAPVTDAAAHLLAPPPDWFVNDVDIDRTVARSGRPVEASAFGPPAERGLIMRLNDGRSFRATQLMLLGRDPVPRAHETGATTVAVTDAGVSKTHVALGQDGDAVWIEDRGSTNGTFFVDRSGRQVSLVPHERAVFPVPATVLIGETAIELGWT
jgi:hypothetical protein